MAEVTYRHPGVYATEIDLTGPTTSSPVGTPAGVIGTADQGPAFVPITVGSYADFAAVFGNTDGEKFGPLAVSEFLKNAQSLTYLRVLGIGNGKERDASTGKVTNAGMVVGARQVQPNGLVAQNPFATDPRNSEGRTYVLGCLMKEATNSNVFTDAGISLGASASVIVRGILMAPSGVILTLSGNTEARGSGQPSNSLKYNEVAGDGDSGGFKNIQGALTGAVNMATQQFIMLLNGHKGTNSNPNVITASFDTQNASYFKNVFNTDPLQIQEKGHYLYADWGIHSSQAVVTGAGLLDDNGPWKQGDDVLENAAFLTTSSIGRNTGNASVPNYESWEERFTHPESPYVISQDFGGTKYNMFKVHAIGDGEYSNTRFKITIENIKPSTSDTHKYGTFDLIVRDWNDSDKDKQVLEAFRGLSMNPSEDRYVGRAIGDQYAYFDFDQATSAQKLVIKGDHPVKSNYIRVEMSIAAKSDQIPEAGLPMGFRGLPHLITSGSRVLADVGDTASHSAIGIRKWVAQNFLKRAVQLPIPFRENVAVGTAPNKTAQSGFAWGCQFTQKVSTTLPNQTGLQDPNFRNFAKFFPSYGKSNMDFLVKDNEGKADNAGTVLDCDKFNNNLFSLERIKVRTGSTSINGVKVADVDHWASASYVRNGKITANESEKTRAFKVDDLKVSGNRSYGKFTFFLQGGWNGVNIFDKDKARLLNAAVKREMDDSTSQGGTAGPTVSAYRKALDIMGTKADVDIKLLAIPGLRHEAVTDYAIDTVESRFDAMYIMDIEERDSLNTVITSSAVVEGIGSANVGYTVSAFKNRALDSSFAAAYFPDLVMTDPTTHTNLMAPPSVGVLGAFALNDAVGYPWYAPAGFTRGTMNNVLRGSVELNTANMDDLYDADINPITDFPGTGIMVFGQKTLLAAPSALDRVNVRRLLINIRRQVRAVANQILFEPNRQETLDKFSALVQPILQSIQEKSGVDRYKVVIDATTTTQADIENNTLRGKIFLQPTRTAEFVALDFVVTNAGDAFENA